MNPNPVFKVTPFFDAEYLTNGYFLNGRKQFVKIGNSVYYTTFVGGGTPQGTVSGPNDFKLVINNLTFNTCYATYVDDTTVFFCFKVY